MKKSREAAAPEGPKLVDNRTIPEKIGYAVVGGVAGMFVGVPAAGFVGVMDGVSMLNYGAGNASSVYQALMLTPIALGAGAMALAGWFKGHEMDALAKKTKDQ